MKLHYLLVALLMIPILLPIIPASALPTFTVTPLSNASFIVAVLHGIGAGMLAMTPIMGLLLVFLKMKKKQG